MHIGALTVTTLAAAALLGCATGTPTHAQRSPGIKRELSAHDQVVTAERAFAKSMTDRSFEAFSSFLSSEAIFFTGSTVEHGAAEIATIWRPYFSGPTAPFSWAPDDVQVLPSGNLALSTGPVYREGKQVGRFNSIWRLEGGAWRIVFDKGEAICGLQ